MNKIIKNALSGSLAFAVALCLFAACSSGVSVEENTIFGSDYVSLTKDERQAIVKALELEECEVDDSCEEPYPRTAIAVSSTKTDNQVTYSICYMKIDSPEDEESATCLDDSDFSKLNVRYMIVAGTSIDDEGTILETGKVHFGGIDLTNPGKPVVRKSDVILPAGRFTLFVEINGFVKKLASFRSVGFESEDQPE